MEQHDVGDSGAGLGGDINATATKITSSPTNRSRSSSGLGRGQGNNPQSGPQSGPQSSSDDDDEIRGRRTRPRRARGPPKTKKDIDFDQAVKEKIEKAKVTTSAPRVKRTIDERIEKHEAQLAKLRERKEAKSKPRKTPVFSKAQLTAQELFARRRKLVHKLESEGMARNAAWAKALKDIPV